MSGDLESPSAALLHCMTSVYLLYAGVCRSAHVQRSGQPASAASDKTHLLWTWGQCLLPTKPASQHGLNTELGTVRCVQGCVRSPIAAPTS